MRNTEYGRSDTEYGRGVDLPVRALHGTTSDFAKGGAELSPRILPQLNLGAKTHAPLPYFPCSVFRLPYSKN